MSAPPVSAGLRTLIVRRARNCCEYCLIPDDVLFVPHEPDHIIAEQHGGQTVSENLALACWRCNRYKGTNLASIDPQSGAREFLFDPRRDRWADHFGLEVARIVGISAKGRATAT